jgi:anti-sigma factor RsiW
MKHLDEGTIHAWLDGELDAAAEQKAEEHAARCTQCASAVADARGLIAAASRILTALDDVPSGVLPPFYAAAPLKAPRRIPAWTLRAAASLFVVAAGTVLVVRNRDRLPSFEKREQAEKLAKIPEANTAPNSEAERPMTAAPLNPADSPAGAMKEAPVAAQAESSRLAQVPAPGGSLQSNAVQPVDKALADAKEKQSTLARDGENGSTMANQDALSISKSSGLSAQKPAAPAATPAVSGAIAPMGKADSLETDQAAARNLALAPKAPRVEVSQATGGAAGKSVSENERAALPPGMKLVKEETQTLDARLVQRKVYEVRPGLKVTFAIFAPAPAESRVDADSAARDSADKRARREFKKVAVGDEAAGINSIQWSDSLGTQFNLSGPLSLDSLRALRPLLSQRAQRP